MVHQEGDRAYYNKAQDRVVLPEPSQFSGQTGYSNTALHEIGHATGAEHRLNRPTMVKHEGFGVGDVREGGTEGGNGSHDGRGAIGRGP